jgi:hypothetical protein
MTSRDNLVGIATSYRLDTEESWSDSRQGPKKTFLSISPRPVLKPIQPPVERAAGTLFLGGSDRDLIRTAPLHLTTRLRASEAVLPLPYSILIVHQDTFPSYLLDRRVGGLTAGLGKVENRKSLLPLGIEIRLSSPSLSSSFYDTQLSTTGMNIHRHAVP